MKVIFPQGFQRCPNCQQTKRSCKCRPSEIAMAAAALKHPEKSGKQANSLALSPETLAASITLLSSAAKELLHSGLNRRAIVVLLADATKLPRGNCEQILLALEDLKRQYTTIKE